MTGEQRFSKLMRLFVKGAKHKYLDAEKLGDMPDNMKLWVVNKKDWMVKYDLHRGFTTHLNLGKGLSLQEFVNSYHWSFTHFSSDENRLMAWLNGGTLLFCETKECETFDSRPFSRPLNEIFEDIIEKRIQEAVKRERRIWEMEQMQKKMDRG